MGKGNKYGAVRVSYEGKTFDSQLERNVFIVMRSTAPFMLVNCQESVLLLPKTDTFPEMRHKIDFFLPEHGIYVEAKGVRTDDWKLRMKILNYTNHDVFKRMLIVSEKAGEKCWNKCYTVDYAGLQQFVKRITHKD
jgi:hypothetical protein